MREQLGSVRVLELGFNKITILPLKMSKLNITGSFYVSVRYSNTGRYSQYLPVRPVRGRYGRYFYRYETQGLTVPDCRPVRYGIDNIDLNKTLNSLNFFLPLFLRFRLQFYTSTNQTNIKLFVHINLFNVECIYIK